MPPTNAAPFLIDAAELARLLSVSKPTIWRMLSAQKIPEPIRLTSQCLRWKRDSVLDWLDSLQAADCLSASEEKQNALATQSPERSKLDRRPSLRSEVRDE